MTMFEIISLAFEEIVNYEIWVTDVGFVESLGNVLMSLKNEIIIKMM